MRSCGGRYEVVKGRLSCGSREQVGGSRTLSGNIQDGQGSRLLNDLLTTYLRLVPPILTTHQRLSTSQYEFSSPVWDSITTTHDFCTSPLRLSAIGHEYWAFRVACHLTCRQSTMERPKFRPPQLPHFKPILMKLETKKDIRDTTPHAKFCMWLVWDDVKGVCVRRAFSVTFCVLSFFVFLLTPTGHSRRPITTPTAPTFFNPSNKT